MLRKCTFIFSVLAVLGTPLSARAQTTMDVAMKIQAVLDQFSEIRSGLKQIQSSMNIESMLQNLGGSGDWKNALKNAAGGVFDKNSERGGTKQSLLLLPEGLDTKADDPDAAKKWIRDNMYVKKKDASFEELDTAALKFEEFQYTSMATAYGKAVAMRKQLDKDISTIEKLRQDAEDKESETDLQNEINKLALLKLEQTNNMQLLLASRTQMEAVSDAKGNQQNVKEE